MVVDSVDLSCDDPHDDERNERDEKPEEHVEKPVPLRDGGDEALARGEADARQKERNPDFAHHEARRLRRVGDEPGEVPEASEKNRDDERPARKTELQGRGHTGHRNRYAPQDNPERKPHENREDVRVIELLHLVAEQRLETLQRRFRSHAVDLVAHLQMEVRIRKERHAGAKDARDVDAVHLVERQGLQGHAIELFPRDQDRAGGERRLFRREIDALLFTPEEGRDGQAVFRSGHDAKDVALLNDRFGSGA